MRRSHSHTPKSAVAVLAAAALAVCGGMARAFQTSRPAVGEKKSFAYWVEGKAGRADAALVDKTAAVCTERLERALLDDFRVERDTKARLRRLDAWLGKEAIAAAIEADPRVVRRFNAKAGTASGPASKWLRWVPMAREARGHSLAHKGFLPINRHEVSFDSSDLDAKSLAKSHDPKSGAPTLYFARRPKQAKAYEAFSERNMRKACAIVVDGRVLMAPYFAGVVRGGAIITGGSKGFTDDEVEDLIILLSIEPLPARLRRVVEATKRGP